MPSRCSFYKFQEWAIPENIHTPPTEEIANRYSHVFGHSITTEVNLKIFLHPPLLDGTTFHFGGGMDLFWNDPILICAATSGMNIF